MIGVCVLDKEKISGGAAWGGGGGAGEGGYHVALAVLPTRSGWSDVKLERCGGLVRSCSNTHSMFVCRWFESLSHNCDTQRTSGLHCFSTRDESLSPPCI